MTHARRWLAAPLVLLLLLGGCREEAADRSSAEKADRDRTLALMPGAPGFECNDIKAFIPIPQNQNSVEGQQCEANKAVVNGWSYQCVAQGQCNTPARLAEVNKAAEDFCARWCAAKKCDFVYAKRDKCDGNNCFNRDECRQNCGVPLQDYCTFSQAAPNFNCECRERIQEKTPPQQQGPPQQQQGPPTS